MPPPLVLAVSLIYAGSSRVVHVGENIFQYAIFDRVAGATPQSSRFWGVAPATLECP